MALTSGSVRARAGAAAGGARAIATAAAALLVVMFMLIAALAGVGGASLGGDVRGAGAGADGGRVSAIARRDIPPVYLRLYTDAGQRYGLDWAILAGIGKVECDHGRDPDPSCDREGAVNSAGAGGPMQFIASTWGGYGVDGDGDGVADRWDPADAIFAAANYLHASGAPGDYRQAIYAYNKAGWYVAAVRRWAATYRGPASPRSPLAQPVEEAGDGDGSGAGASNPLAQSLQAGTSTTVRLIAGERAALSPSDGHLAMVPAGVPAVVQAMLVAGNELQELPYGPGGHPDPRGAFEEDCSSTVNYVLYRSGARPIAEILRRNPLAQDYVGWGRPGPGRWVSVYATTTPTDHTFMLIAGLRLDTSHNGTDVGPNRDEDGPRWRIFDRLPAWAHWSVRHPPGL
jgi:hypothetical protein